MRRTLLVLAVGCLLALEHPRAAPPPGEYAPPPAEVSPDERMQGLAKSDPLAFLDECLARYRREVEGYSATLFKQERLKGKLRDPEVIRVWFKEKPFSVRMDWDKGEALASRTVYVEGENNGKMLVKPSSWRTLFVSVAERDPEEQDAKDSARYPITKFGIQVGTESTKAYWTRAKDKGELRVVFDGLVAVPELDGRKCWKLRRLEYARPEVDGIMRGTFYFDPATWLQVGTVLHAKNGDLIGRYFFKDVKLNPEFPPDTFTRAGLLKPK
ncbi:MAG: DUF1571 domain-containing protein [Gemmataceae bacterium]|nr:DUF1571 domain-containing protein [Gemmataceae bacterium]